MKKLLVSVTSDIAEQELLIQDIAEQELLIQDIAEQELLIQDFRVRYQWIKDQMIAKIANSEKVQYLASIQGGTCIEFVLTKGLFRSGLNTGVATFQGSRLEAVYVKSPS